jgi:hypothetical protein
MAQHNQQWECCSVPLTRPPWLTVRSTAVSYSGVVAERATPAKRPTRRTTASRTPVSFAAVAGCLLFGLMAFTAAARSHGPSRTAARARSLRAALWAYGFYAARLFRGRQWPAASYTRPDGANMHGRHRNFWHKFTTQHGCGKRKFAIQLRWHTLPHARLHRQTQVRHSTALAHADPRSPRTGTEPLRCLMAFTAAARLRRLTVST